MRSVAMSLAAVLVFSVVSVAHAQSQPPNGQADPPPSTPQLKLNIPVPLVAPEPRRFGVFTLTPPTTNGQIIGVGVPVGELVVRAVSSVRNAQRRRAQRNARAQVQR